MMSRKGLSAIMRVAIGLILVAIVVFFFLRYLLGLGGFS
jgi:hypothetical protein